MKKKKFKIIFLGTSDFAVPSLKILLDNYYDIQAVVTIPDRPQGRGLKLKGSPIKEFALKNKLNILQPVNLEDEDFLQKLKTYNADLQVVVAFRMLPKAVWNMPKFGTVNLHASKLPNYRGAAPINWAIINGEEETGITTFFIDEKMDTGKIAFMESEEIFETDTAGELYNRLKSRGARLVLKTVEAIENNDCPIVDQATLNTKNLNKAPKITKRECEIDWNWRARDIYNFIRGLSPIPCAWTVFKDKKYKIYSAKIERGCKLEPGEIFQTSDKLLIGTKTYSISIEKIQPEGKKLIDIKDFNMGNKL